MTEATDATDLRPLDRLVRASHHWTLFGWSYHPYFAMTDLAVVLGIVLIRVFTRTFEVLSFPSQLGVYAIVIGGYYAAYSPIKRRITGITTRSTLQDTALYLFPSFVLASYLLGQPLLPSLDLFGLLMPVLLGTARLGCFLGGCCYGRPSPHGVLYPPEHTKPLRGWRHYTPGPDTGVRVFPLQLVEAAICFAAFGVLAVWLVADGELRGSTLPRFFALYSGWRFPAEFLRGTRHVRRWGPLSQAQWYAAAAFVVCVAVLVIR